MTEIKHELQITIAGKAGTGRTSMGILIQKLLHDAGVNNVSFESMDCTPADFERIVELFEDGTKDRWKSMIEVKIVEVQTARQAQNTIEVVDDEGNAPRRKQQEIREKLINQHKENDE